MLPRCDFCDMPVISFLPLRCVFFFFKKKKGDLVRAAHKRCRLVDPSFGIDEEKN